MNPVAAPIPQPPVNILGGDIAASLLTVNLRAHSRELMMQGRPPKDRRFSGTDSRDFETFWTQFETITNLEGITDQMRVYELPYWTTGLAAMVVSQYEGEKDCTVALKKIKTHLRKEFGQRHFTARQMLDENLSGPKLLQNDVTGIQAFILKLEQTYRRAVDTKRDASFNTQETYNEVLRRKLPFFVDKWATKMRDNQEKWTGDEANEHKELSFETFLDYLRRSNQILYHKQMIRKDENSPQTNQPKPNGQIGGKRNPKIAATDVESDDMNPDQTQPTPLMESCVNVTQTSRPKAKTMNHKKPQGGATPKPLYNVVATSKSKTPTSKPEAPKPKNTQKSEKREYPECPMCNRGRHDLDYCREFQKKTDLDRRQFVLTQGICFNCLMKGHRAQECSEGAKCTSCHKRHHTIFHDDSLTQPKKSEQ